LRAGRFCLIGASAALHEVTRTMEHRAQPFRAVRQGGHRASNGGINLTGRVLLTAPPDAVANSRMTNDRTVTQNVRPISRLVVIESYDAISQYLQFAIGRHYEPSR